MIPMLKYVPGCKPGKKRPAVQTEASASASASAKAVKSKVYEESRAERKVLSSWFIDRPWLLFDEKYQGIIEYVTYILYHVPVEPTKPKMSALFMTLLLLILTGPGPPALRSYDNDIGGGACHPTPLEWLHALTFFGPVKSYLDR